MNQGRFFDELVNIFDRPQPPQVMERLEKIVQMAGIREGDTILDVGAGVGVLVPIIESYRPSRIIACDLSEKMLLRLKEKFPYVEIHNRDVLNLNLEGESVDVIFMNAVFSNIEDKGAALWKSFSLLKKGGRLVISHPEGRDFIKRLRCIVSFHLDLLPTFPELKALIGHLPFKIFHYIDYPKLYLAIIIKTSSAYP
jgi:ubiquinone/menaquinone biosynthesis C-methylase UbiE